MGWVAFLMFGRYAGVCPRGIFNLVLLVLLYSSSETDSESEQLPTHTTRLVTCVYFGNVFTLCATKHQQRA